MQSNKLYKHKSFSSPAFTIVELLIVVVVIGILAAISLVTYSGIQQNAAASILKSDLKNASTQLDIDKVQDGHYPAYDSSGTGIPKSDSTTYEYTTDGTTYCLSATSTRAGVGAFHISNTSGTVQDGVCGGHTAPGEDNTAITDGTPIQNITSTNCPTSRTRAVDARDNHTYWVQKLDDGKCWMLTNLAYGGGGNNTYGDVKAMATGTSANNLTEPRYYIPPNANPTTEPVNPSSSNDGTGQYGYFYNWCAAMGGQIDTPACSQLPSTPIPEAGLPDVSISICPTGWRLPTGGSNSEFVALNNAINGGLTNTNEGLLSVWLGQLGGSMYITTIENQGNQGKYWSSTMYNPSFYTTGRSANYLLFSDTLVSNSSSRGASVGNAVRCLAI